VRVKSGFNKELGFNTSPVPAPIEDKGEDSGSVSEAEERESPG